MNNVSILGNLTTAPKQQVLSSGTIKVSFLVAINEHYTDSQGHSQSKAIFIWVEAFGKLGFNAHKYLVLGQQIAVTGRLSGGNIQLDGEWRNCTVVQANDIQFLGKPQPKTATPETATVSANSEF